MFSGELHLLIFSPLRPGFLSHSKGSFLVSWMDDVVQLDVSTLPRNRWFLRIKLRYELNTCSYGFVSWCPLFRSLSLC